MCDSCAKEVDRRCARTAQGEEGVGKEYAPGVLYKLVMRERERAEMLCQLGELLRGRVQVRRLWRGGDGEQRVVVGG